MPTAFERKWAMTKTIRHLFSWLVILSLSGCNYIQGYVNMMKERGLSEEYAESLRTWTRDVTAHSQLETKFYISATYRSPEFNDAFQKEQARIRQWPEEQTRKQEEMWRRLTSDYREFLVYAYTSDMEANDFGGRNSIWSVFLLDGKGIRHEPLEIRNVERINAELEAFFPFVNKYYGKGYVIRFPAFVEDSEMRLIFASVLGRVDLVWKSEETGKEKQ